MPHHKRSEGKPHMYFKIIYYTVPTFNRMHLTYFWTFCSRNVIQKKEPTYTCRTFIYEQFLRDKNCHGKYDRFGIIDTIRAGSVNRSLSLWPCQVLQATCSAGVHIVIPPINYQVSVSENNELYYFAFYLKKQLHEQNFRKGRTHSLMEIKSKNLTLMRHWQINNCIYIKCSNISFSCFKKKPMRYYVWILWKKIKRFAHGGHWHLFKQTQSHPH